MVVSKIFKPSDYKDVLKHISLSSEEMKERIASFRLSFLNIHNETVEWGMKIPMFARPFYVYIFRKNDIPTQEGFFNYYMLFNKDFFSDNSFDDDIIDGIRARAYRAYPSLIRDVIFNKYVKENIVGYSALYSLDLDINEGIDLMLSNQQNNYAVNLYTATKRAYTGREMKQFRHVPFENVTYVEFPVIFENSHKVGDFFLYGEKEYNDLIERIRELA